MMNLRHATLLPVLVACCLQIPAVTPASDWDRWLGPRQSGQSPEKNVFGDEPELVLAWSLPLGNGYSAIAVSSGAVLTMYGDGEKDWLVALDAKDGSRLWRYGLGATSPKVGASDGGPLSMPVVDDGTVYALAPEGRLIAVKMADGSEVWSLSLHEEKRAPRPFFGFTTTPLVVDDLLFVQVGAPDGGSLVALNKKTGKSVWQIGDEPVGYQSPILTTLAGEEQIVAVTNVSAQGLRPKDGKILWRIEHGIAGQIGWSTPVLIGDGRFVLTGRHESAAFRVHRGDGGVRVAESWRSTSLKKSFAIPVFDSGRLYGFDGDFLACVNAETGALDWKERMKAAGLVLVDGHLVIFKDNGEVLVVAADSGGFETRATIKVAEDASKTFPSFSERAIYVRNLERIARITIGSRGNQGLSP